MAGGQVITHIIYEQGTMNQGGGGQGVWSYFYLL